MTHLTTWGGPCRCAHVHILAIHAFNPCLRAPTPFVYFHGDIRLHMFEFFLCAHDREKPGAWGGWAGELNDVK